ncbi:hypothetical protein M1L60_18995 [Actinoplanes sp. TRM 88003]|uniref:Uncharacterized protein n=1 Tax=Paractinoplanes aksuensis TaxID=2939490 RepID=A0ABT1DPC3_9ACTN|nr:hypothetical protein [Actinoplanes aksuensis]MCO8272684.1 hypothetical protein [Actinoplanes aksuensis]
MKIVDRMRALVDGPLPSVAPPVFVAAASPVEALRAARSVLEADQVLAEPPALDWPAILAAHHAEPFERIALRAVAGRGDCPAELLRTTPFDVALTRGRAPSSPPRQEAVPREVVFAALARIGEVRPTFFGEVTTSVSVDEMITATTRFDLLVRARPGLFWPAVGRQVRPALGRSPSRWLAAAANLPTHRGSLRGFLRKLDDTVPDPLTVNLHLLAQAPDAVIAAILDSWDDETLEQLAGADLVQRGLRAGARPRYMFGWWRPRLNDDHDHMTLWPAIGGAILEGDITLQAEKRLALRRRLVWSRPVDGSWTRRGERRPAPQWTGGNAPADRDPATDLVAELRSCRTALQAEAVLCATLPDDAEPDWPELTAAHRARPLPSGVVRALADRPGFPAALLDALADHHLTELFEHHHGAARTALRRLPWNRIDLSPTFTRVVPAITNGTLTPADIVALAHPARDVLDWMLIDRPPRSPDPDLHPRAATQHNRIRLAREAVTTELTRRLTGVAVNWADVATRLPTFNGTVCELIDHASTEVRQARTKKPPTTARCRCPATVTSSPPSVTCR